MDSAYRSNCLGGPLVCPTPVPISWYVQTGFSITPFITPRVQAGVFTSSEGGGGVLNLEYKQGCSHRQNAAWRPSDAWTRDYWLDPLLRSARNWEIFFLIIHIHHHLHIVQCAHFDEKQFENFSIFPNLGRLSRRRRVEVYTIHGWPIISTCLEVDCKMNKSQYCRPAVKLL